MSLKEEDRSFCMLLLVAVVVVVAVLVGYIKCCADDCEAGDGVLVVEATAVLPDASKGG